MGVLINGCYNETVNKLYKSPAQYSTGMTKREIFCFDDSNSCGEYFSLDLNTWEQLDYSLDNYKRINIGRQHASKEVRIFIQIDTKFEPKEYENLISFNRLGWVELRRIRGENRGLPFETNKNGTIWVGDRFLNSNFKIFIRR